MVTEVILGIITLSLIGFIAWREKHFTLERKELIAGILAKDLNDFTVAVTPPQKEEKKVVTPSEFILEESVSDEDWLKAIKKTNEAN